MYTAKEIMTRDPLTLSTTSGLDPVLELFLEKKFASLPVLDNTNKPIGFITESGLVKCLLIRQSKPGAQQLGHFSDALDPLSSVDEGAPLAAVVKGIFQSSARRVVVLDPIGKLVGIISPKDILKMFHQLSNV